MVITDLRIRNTFKARRLLRYHSVFKLFTGFAIAALIALKLAVINAIITATKPASLAFQTR